MILTPLQKLPKNVGNLDKIIVATGFEWLPKVQKSPNLVTLLACNKVLEMHENEAERRRGAEKMSTKREGNQSGGQLKVGKAAIDVSSKK